MQVIKSKNTADKVRKVRKLMLSTGDLFGSVWSYKRSTGLLKKMAYRLRVQEPTYAPKPTGEKVLYKKAKDAEKNLITVFDTNMIRENNKHRMCGRGGYKSVPVDQVVRLKVGGEIYRFIS